MEAILSLVHEAHHLRVLEQQINRTDAAIERAVAPWCRCQAVADAFLAAQTIFDPGNCYSEAARRADSCSAFARMRTSAAPAFALRQSQAVRR